MERYRISAYLIGDSPRDGKNQILSEKLVYYSKNASVEKPNYQKLNSIKTFLFTEGVDYTNIRLIVHYNNGVKLTEKYSRNEWLNNIDYRDFFLTKEEEIIREKIIMERLRKHINEKERLGIK